MQMSDEAGRDERGVEKCNAKAVYDGRARIDAHHPPAVVADRPFVRQIRPAMVGQPLGDDGAAGRAVDRGDGQTERDQSAATGRGVGVFKHPVEVRAGGGQVMQNDQRDAAAGRRWLCSFRAHRILDGGVT